MIAVSQMFLAGRLSRERIRRLLESQNGAGFSYPEVGATRGALPAGYNIDRAQFYLGQGEGAFERGRSAINRWRMFDIGWIHIYWPDAPAPRSTVGVVARFGGIWSFNVCRIVYVMDGPREYGFAYGTLPEHAESGEERFTVTWREDDSVWYELLAFSRPNQLPARIAYPLTRFLQSKFRRDSGEAMRRSVQD